MKPEDIKKLGLDKAEPEYIKRMDDTYKHLYGDDYVVLENGCVTSKEYAGPIPTRRTNSRLLRVKQIIDVPKKGFLATVRESMTKSGGCCGSGGNCSERPFTSHPIPFEVDMSTSKWRGKPKKPSPRDEYLEYLAYVQTSGTPEPSESYTDWAGLRVMSFKDWLKQRNPRTFERFGIIWPIFFWRGDVFLFILIISTAVALIVTLL